MKRSIGLIVGALCIMFAGAYVSSSYRARAHDAERDGDAQRIRADYLERAAWMRANPEEKSYKDDLGPFFRGYFNEVDEHLKKYGGNKEFDSYLTELDKRDAKGKGDSGGKVDHKAYYAAVRGLFDKMRQGKYSPIHSMTDKGMRLDVLSCDVKMEKGSPKVRYELVLWGAQRELRGETPTQKRMITSASFAAGWKLFDEKEKLVGKMDSSGDPSQKIDWPERFIAEFPPQMVLGHYDLDLVPSTVKNMEITFQVTSHSPTGSEAVAVFPWKLETPSDWKLKPGEKWEGAEEATAPPEDEPKGKAAEPKGKTAKK